MSQQNTTEKKETKTVQSLALEFFNNKSEKIYNELVYKLTPGLMSFARKFSYDENVCKDIVEQTFILVWEKINQYNPEYHFTTWIYTIAKNEALGHINFKKRNLSHDKLSESNSKMLANYSPVEIPEYEVMLPTGENLLKFLYDTSISLINELPEPYKSIMYEKDVKCEQLQTIADKYDCNLSTIKTRLRKARKDIAEIIKTRYPLIVKSYLNYENDVETI